MDNKSHRDLLIYQTDERPGKMGVLPMKSGISNLINTETKKAVVYALASLAKEVSIASDVFNSSVIGRDYFVPKPSDPRLMRTVTTAEAKAAIESGVAGVVINHWKSYMLELDKHTII